MLCAARTACAVTVLGNAEGESAQVGDLTEEVHGLLRVTAFEFAVRGAHAAKRCDPAVRANRLDDSLRLANVVELGLPALRERTAAQVVAIAMGEHADGHASRGVHGATVLSASAGIPLRGMLSSPRQFALDELAVRRAFPGIAEIQGDGLF